ncbi:DUF2218 domain-containing protein [Iodobacter sp.]|jgi:hypothetical protein|uniref:DUF2218 domain-containing protein n=1 Tax=Iodobacter sp. TaxID=1915058 RepID=UPI0025FE3381|nr:DUF2218 domain-containing protein [Iodobacter sp.]
MLNSRSQLTVPLADKVLYKLCKHYALKIPVEFDSERAYIPFAMGECHIRREQETLFIHCLADTADKLAKIELVMDEHLGLMVRNPELALDWQA